MARTKADLLQEAAELSLEVSAKNTVAEIQSALDDSTSEEVTEAPAEPTKAAKAGKRSTKGQEEAEAKAEKIEHQKHREESTSESAKPKQPVKPTRTRLERRSKGYRKSAELIDKTKHYSLAEAVELAIKTSTVKFDASVELHINLDVDPKHADQNIRGNLVLPNGTGKSVRVAVFDDSKIDGADLSGIEKISKQLEAGEVNFDTLIASPANMAKLGKFARLLGPRGLMPNPKSGTVTQDLNKAVQEAKAGKLDYRVDAAGIVHAAVGKVSFKPSQLVENAEALLTSIKNAKPSSIKGNYFKAAYVTTSMGPSVKLEAAAFN